MNLPDGSSNLNFLKGGKFAGFKSKTKNNAAYNTTISWKEEEVRARMMKGLYPKNIITEEVLID